MNYVIQFRKYNYKILIIFRNGEQMKKLDNEVKAIMKDAAKRLTGFKRRAYQAKIAIATILSWILSYQGVEQLFMPYFFIFQKRSFIKQDIRGYWFS